MRFVRHCEYKSRNELRDYEPRTSLMVYSFIEMVLGVDTVLNVKEIFYSTI